MRSALLLALLLGGCGAIPSPRLRFVSSVATEASWSFVVDDHGRGAEFLVDGRDRDVGCDRAGQQLRCELRGMFPGGHTIELRLPGAVLRRSVLIGQPWPERVVLARVRDEGELEAAARAHVDGVILIGGDRLHLTAEAHKHSLRALLLPEELATLNETAADGIVGAPIPADQLARFPELRSFTVDRQRSDALEAQLLRGDSPAPIIAAGDGLLDAQSLAAAALALGAPHGVIVNSVGFPLLEARRRHSALRRGEVTVRSPVAGLVQLDFTRGSDRVVVLCNVGGAPVVAELDLRAPLSLLGQSIDGHRLVVAPHDVAMLVATPSTAAPAEVNY